MLGTAQISPCGLYRYALTRDWTPPGETPRSVCFCGLNSSTADAEAPDPTITREISFAKRLGATRLLKVNLYAFRTKDPKVLIAQVKRMGDNWARGDDNLLAIRDAVDEARRPGNLGVFAAWGALPRPLYVSAAVFNWLGRPLFCLGTTKDGHPRHPLYLKGTATPEPWTPP